MTTQISSQEKNGSASAILLATGIGCLAIGLFTVGSAASSSLKGFLNWYGAAGSISGKFGAGVLVWLIAWGILHHLWKDKDVSLPFSFTIMILLFGIGLGLTFPPIFELFK